MKYKILAGILLATQLLYGVEEAFLQLKSKGAINDFYRVYYDSEKDQIYMGIESYLNFTKIKSLKVDRQRMKLVGTVDDGRTFNKSLDVPGKIVEPEDIYIPLNEMTKIFEATEVKWNNNDFSLTFNPGFKTPSELAYESYENRRKLDAENAAMKELELESSKGRFFSPGVFKLNYSNYDLSNSDDYSFSLEYGTQLLKGDFEIGYQVAPESSLDYVLLKYEDFYKDMDLVFGDAILQTEMYYDTESTIRGVSISKDSYFGYQTDDSIVIEGQAINASLVELYRDNVLQEYIRPRGNNFRFQVPNFNGLNEYSVRIYYRDGSVETRRINILGDTTVLGKGNTDYILQVGQGINDKKLQALGRIKYGVTDNLTLGVGASRFEGKDDDDDDMDDVETTDDGKDPVYELIEGQFAYRLPFSFIPTIVGGTIFRENNYGENNYRADLKSDILGTTFYVRYEKLGEQAAENREVEEYYDIGLTRGFDWFSLSVGNLHEKYSKYADSIRDSRNTAYVDLNITSIQNTNISIYNQYIEDYDGKKEFEVTGRVLYTGFESFYAILSATQRNKKNDNEESDRVNEYEISLIRNVNSNSIFKNLDITADAKYSDDDKWVFGIDFTYYFDGWIYVETPLRIRDDKTTVGLEVEKAFYLGDPLRKMNNSSVRDSWIEGEVFLDTNGNGKKDRDETVLSEVEIVAGGYKGKTDKNGKYLVGNLTPNTEHKVSVNKETIDATLNPIKDNFTYRGRASIGKNINIPVAPYSIISGNILNKNMTNIQFYNTLLGTEVILKKNGQEVMKAQLETDGYYHFMDVLPGEYTVELVIVSQREIIKNKSEIKVNVKSGEEGDFYEGKDFEIGMK